MAGAALDHLVVVDRSDTIAGQYCSRLLADYGARVLLSEPDGGSPLRMGPAVAGTGRAFLFHHLNTGKESVEAAGDDLLAVADVILLRPDEDPDAVAARFPAAVVVAISDFGSDGPLRDWTGAEIVFQALAGMMNNNGAAGREPLYGTGDRASFAAGLAACVGTLTALHARGDGAPGQVVRVDVAETAAAMCFPYVVQHIYNGTVRQRTDLAVPAGQVECRDGWVCIWIYNHRWAAVLGALGLEHLRDDPRFAANDVRRRNWAALFALIGERVRDEAAEDVVEALQKAQVIAAKSYRPSELGTARHLVARGYWAEAGGQRVLGPPWRLSRTPRVAPRPAPALGSHGPLPSPRPQRSRGTPGAPLAGIRVVELTTAWAGPMAGRILAHFGAEAIHVESANRVNSWRLNHEVPNPINFPAREPGARPFDRSFLFNSQNVNKLSCTVDLKTEDGRRLLASLAEKSDVLICNFRPGTLQKFGLDHATLAARNPGLIVCEMPAFGSTGPMAHHAALGPTMEMAAGMSAMIGYPDGPPETTGPSYMDPVGGFNAAGAILTALLHRQRTGEGQAIELPQVEAAMHLVGHQILEAMATGVDLARAGNRRPDAAPHDAFPAAGADQWIAIAAFDDRQFRALCGAIDQPELADDARFATLAARKANEDALDALLAEWTAGQDKHAAAARLQATGVPAAAVATAEDVARSPYLAARGFFAELDHPDAGRHAYPGLPVHLSATPGVPRTAAPPFGRDNERVLREILALDPTAAAALRQAAGMVDVPLPGV